MPMAKTSTWKNTERELAKALNDGSLDVERLPVSGRQRGSAPDIKHPFLSIEVKHRKNPPALLVDAMDQAQKSKRGVQLPVVILHQSGRHHKNDLVIFRLEDFLAIHKEMADFIDIHHKYCKEKDEQENS
jgi:Holliday junction resolvase hjc